VIMLVKVDGHEYSCNATEFASMLRRVR